MKESRTTSNLQIGRRVTGAALAALLALGLAPGVALADLGAGSASTPIEKQAAKKTTVYVLVKSTKVVKGDSLKITTTNNYTINSKTGLLKKAADKSKGDYKGAHTTTWAYDKNNNLKTVKLSGNGATETINFVATKSGLLKKDSRRYVSGPLDNIVYKSAYTAKSGKIVKVKRVSEFTGTETYTLKYKGNKVVRVKDAKNGYDFTYTYDKKGNLLKSTYLDLGKKVTVKYKNTYDKKGNLIKSKRTENDSTITTTYKLKAVKVPKSLAKKVKAQQWALQNVDTNFSIGMPTAF